MLGSKKSEGGDRQGLARGLPAEAETSILGSGMTIVGDLITDGTVRIQGRVEGTVRAGKSVMISDGGEVVGEIFTQDAVIAGVVRGTVVAESRLELQKTGDIQGQVRARAQHLILAEGARFNGEIQMLDGSEAPALPRVVPAENSTTG
jgi:cytoskeletal protein CcmA (bactofilin family)